MKHNGLKFALRAAVMMLPLLMLSCRDLPEYSPTSKYDAFEALWTQVDERYCFFNDKKINWDSIHEEYSKRVKLVRTTQGLFEVCAAMLDELKDGHVNLACPFATSYYQKWWSDYPDCYDERLVEEYYFNFNYRRLGNVTYGILVDNIGYIRYPSFSSGLGKGNIDYILNSFNGCQALIFDVRENGGGDMSNVGEWVERFVREKSVGGYISHKTGPGHNDFSKPYAFYYEPIGDRHYAWRKPVVVLADRGTFSAANNFVSVMKSIPEVAIVGTTTGGGCGMPLSSELPNGWLLRMSSCPIYDANLSLTEFGVEPSEGCYVELDPLAALNGRDTIIDFACEYLKLLINQ